MYNQREIILTPFPYSDLTGSKQRPAIIISNELVNNSEDIICCLITSNKPKDGIKIKKEDFESGKLPFDSWVKPHRIFTVNQKIVNKRICKVSNNFQKELLKKINSLIA